MTACVTHKSLYTSWLDTSRKNNERVIANAVPRFLFPAAVWRARDAERDALLWQKRRAVSQMNDSGGGGFSRAVNDAKTKRP
jgi:hypothetical protein